MDKDVGLEPAQIAKWNGRSSATVTFFDTRSISTNQKLPPPPQKTGSLPMPIAETCQLYRGYPPGHRPEEMCKVLIAGSDEQVASARRGILRTRKKNQGILIFFYTFSSFQHSKKKKTNTFCTCLHHFYIIYPSNIQKKDSKSKVFFHANLAKPIFSRSPFDAVSLQGAGGIPGGRGAADYGVAQVRSLNVGDVVWVGRLVFSWSHIYIYNYIHCVYVCIV